MTVQNENGLKSLTILVVLVLGIKVTRVQFMAIYNFSFPKKSLNSFMTSYW